MLLGLASLLTTFANVKVALAVLNGTDGFSGLLSLIGGAGSGLTGAFSDLSGAIDGTVTSLGSTSGGGLLGTLGLTGTQFLSGVVLPIVSGIAVLKGAFDENGNVTEEWEQHAQRIFQQYEGDFDTWGQQMITGYDEYGNAITASATKIANQQIAQTRNANEKTQLSARQHNLWMAMNYDDLGNKLTVRTSETARQMTTNFTNAGSGMVSGMARGASGARATADNIAQQMRIPLTSVRYEASSWGSDVASNFAAGIRNGISWVANAASTLASKVRQFIHFSEPDIGPLSDFHTYMPDMLKEMAKGIYDNSYLVENAMNSLAGTMAIGNNLPYGNSSTSYSYGGININLNVSDQATGKQLIDEIEQELARRMTNRKAVFGQ